MTDSLRDTDIEALARNLLRAQLMVRGWSYARLAEALQELGVEETEASIKNKVSRGRFTFVFFLQSMIAIGSEELRVPRLEALLDGEFSGAGAAQRLARRTDER
ncbi:DUF6471 domain-containing protein [Qipengyuania spongiae]|uniref:DUF6471 domain-containing protein n=1 Tax=Qipengyuania spongiae TaxID=2909673 RepID=A0ABY5SV13_9SPHN|nr:DUF6471 domain-containing protein [Qipengyuania spongiae]UVI38387.1 DUF6471 domain-containing protein [Qipengyuania spongiae]